jgi:hypothetical protein
MSYMAITTRFIGPSNTRGSRIKATARKAETWGGERRPELSLTDDYVFNQNSEQNHCRVAHLLAVKLAWSGLYVAGALPDGSGYAFVNLGERGGRMTVVLDPATHRENIDWFYVANRRNAAKELAE